MFHVFCHGPQTHLIPAGRRTAFALLRGFVTPPGTLWFAECPSKHYTQVTSNCTYRCPVIRDGYHGIPGQTRHVILACALHRPCLHLFLDCPCTDLESWAIGR